MSSIGKFTPAPCVIGAGEKREREKTVVWDKSKCGVSYITHLAIGMKGQSAKSLLKHSLLLSVRSCFQGNICMKANPNMIVAVTQSKREQPVAE